MAMRWRRRRRRVDRARTGRASARAVRRAVYGPDDADVKGARADQARGAIRRGHAAAAMRPQRIR